LSWRVSLLPFLGHGELFQQFNLDEPWDSPHNLSLLPFMPDVFANPNVAGPLTLTQVVTSPFPGAQRTLFPESFISSSLGSAQDGTANTIAFVEANIDQAVEWTKPQDLSYDDSAADSDPTEGWGEAFFGLGSHVALAEGSVRFVRSCIEPENARRLLLAADGQPPGGVGCVSGSLPSPSPFPVIGSHELSGDFPDGFFGGGSGNSPSPLSAGGFLSRPVDRVFEVSGGLGYTGARSLSVITASQREPIGVAESEQRLEFSDTGRSLSEPRAGGQFDSNVDVDLVLLSEFDTLLDDLELDFVESDPSFFVDR